MYWSAALCTIGRTVVEPLILIVSFWPDETGDVTAGTARVVVTAAVVGEAVGTVVATGVVVAVLVHPATSASTKTVTRHREIFRNEFHFALIVFYHPFHQGY